MILFPFPLFSLLLLLLSSSLGTLHVVHGGAIDWIPVLSQCKSAIQAICGDRQGARETQIRFSKRCPIVSQTRSVLQLCKGNGRGALETQRDFCCNAGDVVNCMPVWGHVKGTVHYMCGQTEAGTRAMAAATRSAVVAGAGVATLATAGAAAPAAAAGILTGLAYDGTATGVASIVHQEFKPYGYYALGKHINDKVRTGQNVAGDLVEMAAIPMADAMLGQSGLEFAANNYVTPKQGSGVIPLGQDAKTE